MHHSLLALLTVLPLVAASGAADGLNRFAAEAYPQLSKTKGNLVFSPLSISTVLAMALTGARGETASEITAVLHVPLDAEFLDALGKAGNASGDELLLAQALWLDRGFPALPGFVDALDVRFHAKPAVVDFATNPESARAAINQWTSQKTKGKIAELFAPGSLANSTRLALSSAVYFNGKWQSPFDAKRTQPAPFRTPSDATVQTPFMNRTARFPYGETGSAQVLELPYAGGSLAFDVILPKPGATIDTIEEAFHADGISAWVGSLQTKQVAVALPKFRAEAAFNLRDALSAMGMGGAFSSAADFSGIDGRRDLAISEVMHKAFIDVSEEGTEAAAATGMAVSLTAFAPAATFRADHPFLFLIRDTGSGAILFAGRFEQPKE